MRQVTRHRTITSLMLGLAALGCYARQPERGYRGFVEWSNSLRSDYVWNYLNSTTTYYTGLSTSHGYQFNSWLFAGAGIDYEHCSKISSDILALFAEGRADLQLGRLTPFGDLRIGWNVSRGGGIYFSPTVGYRFNWGRKVGVNIGIGLTLQGYNLDTYTEGIDADGYWSWIKTGTHRGCTPFFSFRLGFDF